MDHHHHLHHRCMDLLHRAMGMDIMGHHHHQDMEEDVLSIGVDAIFSKMSQINLLNKE